MQRLYILLTLFAAVAIMAPGHAQTIEACTAGSESKLVEGLQGSARAAYQNIHEEFDYDTHVLNAWNEADMDAVLAEAAARAGQDLEDRWWAERFTGYGIYAEEAVEEIAEATFSDPRVRAGLDAVVAGATDRFAAHLSNHYSNVAGALGVCFSEYLDVKYPAIVARAADDHLAAIETPDAPEGVGKDAAAAVEGNIARGLGGVVLAASAMIRKRVIERVTRSLSGRLLVKGGTKLVPILGLGLLINEIVNEGSGSVPQIVEGMHSPPVPEQLQMEIAQTMRQEVAGQIDVISAEVTRHALVVWQDFKKSNELILSLHETSPAFRAYLSQFSRERDLAPVRDAVLLLAEIGALTGIKAEKAVLDAIDRGLIAEVARLQPPARKIAKDERSVDVGIAWQRLSGGRIAEVEAAGLHRYVDPADLDRDELLFILSFEAEAVRAVALLPATDRREFMRLDPPGVQRLAATLGPDELHHAVAALRGLDNMEARNRVFAHITGAEYESDRIVEQIAAIGESRDEVYAAGLLLDGRGVMRSLLSLDPLHALWKALNGDVSGRLVATVFGTIFSGWGIFVALALGILFYMRPFRSRQQITIRHESAEPRPAQHG